MSVPEQVSFSLPDWVAVTAATVVVGLVLLGVIDIVRSPRKGAGKAVHPLVVAGVFGVAWLAAPDVVDVLSVSGGVDLPVAVVGVGQ